MCNNQNNECIAMYVVDKNWMCVVDEKKQSQCSGYMNNYVGS